MMDDFLREAQADWRSHPADPGPALDQVRQRLRRTRWLPHVLIGCEILGGSIAILIGLWFASVALERRDLLFSLSATVMLTVLPALVIASVVARRASRRWEDETPESVLRTGLARAETSLAAIRLGYWHGAVVAGFVALLWIVQGVGMIDAVKFLVFYTAVFAAILLLYLPWLSWRKRRLLREHAVCERLLEDFQVNDTAVTDSGSSAAWR